MVELRFQRCFESFSLSLHVLQKDKDKLFIVMIWEQISVYIGLIYKNTTENVLIDVSSYFISSSINWSGELGVDAVEARGNN